MRPLFALVAVLATSLFACASSPEGEDAETENASAITGTVSNARACAIRDAYLRADITDLELLGLDGVASAPKATITSRWPNDPPESIAKLTVAGVGEILVVEQTYRVDDTGNFFTNLDFIDARGEIIVYGYAVKDVTTFSSSYATSREGGLGPALQCSTPASQD